MVQSEPTALSLRLGLDWINGGWSVDEEVGQPLRQDVHLVETRRGGSRRKGGKAGPLPTRTWTEIGFVGGERAMKRWRRCMRRNVCALRSGKAAD